MCGRYCISTAPEAIRRIFRYPQQPNFPPRYNVAPTQPVPIVRVVNGEREFALVRWGLIPSWVKDAKDFTLLINARGESVQEKPAFKNAIRRRRCLFPADGFYEWKTIGARKHAFFARPKGGGPVAFAGVWESWMGPNGEEMETAAIVTTEANREMAAVHHRAPVIVPPDQFDFWLDPRIDGPEAAALIRPAPDDSMNVYEVSSAVNRVANDTPDLILPARAGTEPQPEPASRPRLSRRKTEADTGQGTLF